jgi:hypothetical protein
VVTRALVRGERGEPIAGSATLTTVTSSSSIAVAADTTASISGLPRVIRR